MARGRGSATVLATLAATAALALGAAAPAGAAGLLQPPRGQTFFGVSDSGVASPVRRILRTGRQAPGGDRDLPGLGIRPDGLDQALAERRSAPDPPHLHRRPQRRARADHPARHRARLGRRLPDRPQPALLVTGDACLPAPAGRAEPLPQRLRRLRLRRAAAGRLPEPYWYRQAFRRIYIVLHGGGSRAEDRRSPRRGRPAAAAQPERRRCRPALPAAPIAVIWSPLPGRLAGDHAGTARQLLPRAALRRLGRDRLLLRLSPTGRR